MMQSKVVVALDLPDRAQAVELARAVLPATPWVKVGLELFAAAGPCVINELKQIGCLVFLDLKFYDIPNTVLRAVRSAVTSGADMCDIHLCGGETMARAAVQGIMESRRQGGRCKLFGVTVLTSALPEELGGLDVQAKVTGMALAAKAWGLDGVVCSGLEAAAVKAACGSDFACLCPGIRPAGKNAPPDDQRRVLTPLEAARAGADFLVVGRPVSKAENPTEAALSIVKSLES